MAEEGDEFGHRNLHRADPVFESGLELARPTPAGSRRKAATRSSANGSPIRVNRR